MRQQVMRRNMVKELIQDSAVFAVVFLMLMGMYDTLVPKKLKKAEPVVEMVAKNIGSGRGRVAEQPKARVVSQDKAAVAKSEPVVVSYIAQGSKEVMKPVDTSAIKNPPVLVSEMDPNAYFRDVVFPGESAVDMSSTNVYKDPTTGDNFGVLTVNAPYAITGLFEYYINQMPANGWEMASYQVNESEKGEIHFINHTRKLDMVMEDNGAEGTIIRAHVTPKVEDGSSAKGLLPVLVRDTDPNAYFKDVLFANGTVVDMAKTQVYKDLKTGETFGNMTVKIPYAIRGVFEFYLNKMHMFGWDLDTYSVEDEKGEIHYKAGSRRLDIVMEDAGSEGTVMKVSVSIQ